MHDKKTQTLTTDWRTVIVFQPVGCALPLGLFWAAHTNTIQSQTLSVDGISRERGLRMQRDQRFTEDGTRLACCSRGTDWYCCTSTACCCSWSCVVSVHTLSFWQSKTVWSLQLSRLLVVKQFDWLMTLFVCVFEPLPCRGFPRRVTKLQTTENLGQANHRQKTLISVAEFHAHPFVTPRLLYISLTHAHSRHLKWTFQCQLLLREQTFFASLRIPFVCEGRKSKAKQSYTLPPLC